MTLAPDARRRVLAASLALTAYSAGCTPAEAPEPQHTAHPDTPKLDYPAPHSIETADSYRVEQARPPRARVGRSRARGGEGRAPQNCTLDDIKRMESGGDYGAVSPTGKYRGAHQFDARTWRGAVTRAGYPEYADTPVNQVPPAVQDAAAAQLYRERGTQPWNVCK